MRPTTHARAKTRTALSGCALTVLSPFALDYVVQPGDTVSEIASRNGVAAQRLVDANDLPAGGARIYAGEVLAIPAAHGRGQAAGAAPARPDGAAAGDDGRRRVVWHRVRPGDTMTAIAVRYHAWTDELIAANGADHTLTVGERVKVPVVVSRADEGRDRRGGASSAETSARAEHSAVERLRSRLEDRPDPGRATVRRMIERTARDAGVDPDLALAVSWQEAGWQQHHVSPDRAIGAMQVIPTTGAWVGDMVGRDLDLLQVQDNVTAGVELLAYLTDAAPRRRAIAGYYQGLAGVREHGMYDDTRAYVTNVLALRRAFSRGDYPS